MSKKKQVTIEDMEKALEIKITAKEQAQLKELGWDGMIRKAMTYNPNIKAKKRRARNNPAYSLFPVIGKAKVNEDCRSRCGG